MKLRIGPNQSAAEFEHDGKSFSDAEWTDVPEPGYEFIDAARAAGVALVNPDELDMLQGMTA